MMMNWVASLDSLSASQRVKAIGAVVVLAGAVLEGAVLVVCTAVVCGAAVVVVAANSSNSGAELPPKSTTARISSGLNASATSPMRLPLGPPANLARGRGWGRLEERHWLKIWRGRRRCRDGLVA